MCEFKTLNWFPLLSILPWFLPSFLLSIPSFLPLFLHSFLSFFVRSFLPSNLPSFLPFFLHSFYSSFLSFFLCSFFPSFHPSFFPSFLPSFFRSFVSFFFPSFIGEPEKTRNQGRNHLNHALVLNCSTKQSSSITLQCSSSVKTPHGKGNDIFSFILDFRPYLTNQSALNIYIL